jgi:hypothetical protein
MHSHSWQASPQLHFPLQIANGVLAVRDMMDCPKDRDPLLACAAEKRRWSAAGGAGALIAPRFIGIASYYFEDPTLDAGDAAARARTYKARGIDFLKVYNRVSRGTYLRLAKEGRALGMPVVGHLPQSVTLDEAIGLGQRSFEHAHLFLRACFARATDHQAGRLAGWSRTRLAEAMAADHDAERCARHFAAMRARGAGYVPTHVTREEDARAGDPAFLHDHRLRYADPLSRWAWRDDAAGTLADYPGAGGRAALGAYFAKGLELTGAAHRAGVPVLVGTDTILAGFKYHDELGHLVRSGLSPAAALRAATIDAARFVGRSRDFGTIEGGKVADLVLLTADPLADIGATRRIAAVVYGGRFYDRARLDALLDFTRSQARHPGSWAKMIWGFVTSPASSDL